MSKPRHPIRIFFVSIQLIFFVLGTFFLFLANLGYVIRTAPKAAPLPTPPPPSPPQALSPAAPLSPVLQVDPALPGVLKAFGYTHTESKSVFPHLTVSGLSGQVRQALHILRSPVL